MTIRDIYAICVGAAGLSHRELMHDLRWWQIQAVIEGYNRRSRPTWEQTRWQTFCILTSLGSKVQQPSELLPFPWDTEGGDDITDEEYDQLQKDMAEMNKQRKK